MKIDPFEVHPELPAVTKKREARLISLGQLDLVIESVTNQLEASPDKTWGHSKKDIARWVRMVIDEAEKIPIT